MKHSSFLLLQQVLRATALLILFWVGTGPLYAQQQLVLPAQQVKQQGVTLSLSLASPEKVSALLIQDSLRTQLQLISLKVNGQPIWLKMSPQAPTVPGSATWSWEPDLSGLVIQFNQLPGTTDQESRLEILLLPLGNQKQSQIQVKLLGQWPVSAEALSSSTLETHRWKIEVR